MKLTKIVCTIGPKSENENTLKELLEEGMDVMRLNFSHGDFDEHGGRIDLIRKLDPTVPVMLDTKGPEIRTGDFDGDVHLKEGSIVTIRHKDVVGDENEFSISYKTLSSEIKEGDRILIDDGLVELKVTQIVGKDVRCVVMNSGEVSSKKGVNLPDTNVTLPSLTEKDVEDIKFGVSKGIDLVAVSFVRSAQDVKEVRKLLDSLDSDAEIISKIEHRLAVENIDSILEESDGVMIARGDLGVEYDFEKVPLIQKEIIEKARDMGKYTIVATQMLNSMIDNPRATRAEVSDVANAIIDGTDAVMLSGETAKGKYPLQSVRTMKKIILEVEAKVDFSWVDVETNYVSESIAKSCAIMAMDLGIEKIIVPTKTGYSAKLVSRHSATAKIFALVSDERVGRKLSVVYGVEPVVIDSLDDIMQSVVEGTKKLVELKEIEKTENVIISGGFKNEKTNGVIINKVSNLI